MTATDMSLVATDGRQLAATVYEPDTYRASVALLGAWAVPRRYYRRFAMWLCGRGYRVLTFDCRGVGDSSTVPVKKETATTTDWAVLDHGAALDWLDAEPGPHLVVGHSFGGQIPGITDKARVIDGLYAVGAQLGYWGHWSGWQRVYRRAQFSVAMPVITRAFGYMPKWFGLGGDIPPGALLEWATWLRSPNYLVDHVPGAAERFRSWPGQIIVCGFTDDTYAPPPGVSALADCYDPAHVDLRIRSPRELGLRSVGHFGFFREGCREVLWRECADELDRWVAGA